MAKKNWINPIQIAEIEGLIRKGGLSVQEISLKTSVSPTTVRKIRKAMGLAVPAGKLQNYSGITPRFEKEEGSVSAAEIRLAQFDPIVARAIKLREGI